MTTETLRAGVVVPAVQAELVVVGPTVPPPLKLLRVVVIRLSEVLTLGFPVGDAAGFMMRT